ncbi:endonuclease [Blastococcus sp. TBT05-19]|uniref:HNH endonuclease signature motif containing protein n=1 Tax=Blastococcus sp. TBT05-19 TaxID=2250581 RepID=UPI000DE937D6|nr:HNH endonuclease signature motif containing protein [Blastococcus sp. TBT05-19]RBY94341.1 endonuclease [Blastococcus sp. TBT05-19]
MRSTGSAALEAALDELSSERLDGMFGPQLLERLGDLLTAQNRLAAEVARMVRQCELAGAAEVDGKASMPAWLRGHRRMSQAAASAVVRNGRALEQMPALAAAFASGAVSAEAVGVIAPVAAPQNVAAAEASGVDLAQIDELLTEVAAGAFHADLRKAVAHYLERLDPDGEEPDPTEQRSFTLVKHADGSVSGRFELDAVGGEKAQAAIESIVQADRPAGDTRTRAQQQGDAFVQLCDNQLAAGGLPTLRTVKPHVVVTIPLEDLVGSDTGLATADLGFGATISAARARWLACDGNVTRIVIGPEGQPLDLGRTHRVVPHPLRRVIEHRDRHCVFAGCDAPTHWCDVHHLIHWAHGGETEPGNLALLCERHHTKVHHGFRIERQPDGRWRTYRPDDTEILVLPRIATEPASTRAG